MCVCNFLNTGRYANGTVEDMPVDREDITYMKKSQKAYYKRDAYRINLIFYWT